MVGSVCRWATVHRSDLRTLLPVFCASRSLRRLPSFWPVCSQHPSCQPFQQFRSPLHGTDLSTGTASRCSGQQAQGASVRVHSPQQYGRKGRSRRQTNLFQILLQWKCFEDWLIDCLSSAGQGNRIKKQVIRKCSSELTHEASELNCQRVRGTWASPLKKKQKNNDLSLMAYIS